MNTIAIVDYGMGNLHSIAKAFEHVAGDVRHDELAECPAGVGEALGMLVGVRVEKDSRVLYRECREDDDVRV